MPYGETACLHSRGRWRVMDTACDASVISSRSPFVIQCMVCFPGKTRKREEGDVMGEVCGHAVEMCMKSEYGMCEYGVFVERKLGRVLHHSS